MAPHVITDTLFVFNVPVEISFRPLQEVDQNTLEKIMFVLKSRIPSALVPPAERKIAFFPGDDPLGLKERKR
jgi:hypothetical protein